MLVFFSVFVIVFFFAYFLLQIGGDCSYDLCLFATSVLSDRLAKCCTFIYFNDVDLNSALNALVTGELVTWSWLQLSADYSEIWEDVSMIFFKSLKMF